MLDEKNHIERNGDKKQNSFKLLGALRIREAGTSLVSYDYRLSFSKPSQIRYVGQEADIRDKSSGRDRKFALLSELKFSATWSKGQDYSLPPVVRRSILFDSMKDVVVAT